MLRMIRPLKNLLSLLSPITLKETVQHEREMCCALQNDQNMHFAITLTPYS